ncbi:MAG: DeoR/GlpR transcriptional regulator [Acidobacteria bacterium]|nr:DeoR/GlpR transcriptional regulator [Acidobacteriota bacterium]
MGGSNRQRLLVEERRRKILEVLEQHERVTVQELVKRFGVSAVTIRGDLDTLTEAGALVRSHGGALKPLGGPADISINVKEILHHEEKVRIGAAAAQLIQNDETIILDSGTTTLEVARQIAGRKFKSLTVITNGLNLALELARLSQVRLIVIGGMLRHVSYSVVGPHAEHMLQGLNADRLFLGVDGVDLNIGLMTPDVLEAQLNSQLIRVAREVNVVADASKFRRRSLSLIARLESVHRIITDDKIDADTSAAIRGKGIELVVV